MFRLRLLSEVKGFYLEMVCLKLGKFQWLDSLQHFACLNPSWKKEWSKISVQNWFSSIFTLKATLDVLVITSAFRVPLQSDIFWNYPELARLSCSFHSTFSPNWWIDEKLFLIFYLSKIASNWQQYYNISPIKFFTTHSPKFRWKKV